MLITVLVLHGVIGVAVFGAGRPLGRRAFAIAAIAPAVTLAWLVALLDRTLNGRVTRQSLEWVPALDLSITLRLDAFAAVMALIITIVGLAVLGYSCSYFDPDDPGLGRLAGLLTLFGGAMLGIVLADDLITLFTAWEITSVVSYLLIGNEHTRTQARAAALHALLVTSTGGLAMLAGIVLIGQAAGTYRISELLRDPPTGTTVTTGLVLVAVGAFTKSAQYPFHSWLPGAMAAPTPVSAYLHSATMVKAGVYLLARFAPVFALHAPWRPLVVTVGLVTMIAGGLRALRQYDLKLLLAHGTVSQLGFLVVLFGVGIPGATAAGILAIVAHAAFKAALFLTVGVIDHQTGTRDIRLVPPLGDGWRVVKVTVVVRGRVDGGCSAARRLSRQGGGVRRVRRRPLRRQRGRGDRRRRRISTDRCVHGTFRVGNPAPAGAPALGQRGRHHPASAPTRSTPATWRASLRRHDCPSPRPRRCSPDSASWPAWPRRCSIGWTGPRPSPSTPRPIRAMWRCGTASARRCT